MSTLRSPRDVNRRIVLAAALVAAGEAAALFALGGSDGVDATLGAFVRVTARTSLLWFLFAFVARPLTALAPSPASKWLLRHRRGLGLGFAVSHAAHLAGIVALAARLGDTFWAALATSTIVGGSLGFAVLAAMAATSTDGAQRRLGRSRWRALHLTGMWLSWLIFTGTYAPMAAAGAALPALFTVLLVAAATPRPIVALQRRARRA